VARSTAAAVKTLATAMTTCTVPGTTPNNYLDDKTIEVGLGIHGEPGMIQKPWKPAADLVADMLDVIASRLQPPARAQEGAQERPPSSTQQGNRPVVLMVNSLGGTPSMERYVVAHDALTVCRRIGFEPVRVMVGAFMTALEMQGVSLSMLPVDGEDGALLLERIDRPTTALAWTGSSTESYIVKSMKPARAPIVMALSPRCADPHWVITPTAVVAIEAACDALEAAEPQLTAWDQIAGDGDCGITVQRGAVAVRSIAPMLAGMNAAKGYGAIADAVAGSMGGTLGALLEILFRAGRIFLLEDTETPPITAQEVTRDQSPETVCCTPGQSSYSGVVDHSGALYAGTMAIANIGGAEAGMRTMLDALLPAAEKLRKSRSGDNWAEAVRAAEAGAEDTLLMEGLAGRSNYINAELLKTVPDPGAKAVAIAFRAALEATSC